MEDPNLETTYKKLRDSDPRRAAEIAYVLARIYLNKGDREEAKRYGRESVQLFESLNIQTIDDTAAKYTVINGIALPSYIHENVVRDRLRLEGLDL
jgi:hypothetical protein